MLTFFSRAILFCFLLLSFSTVQAQNFKNLKFQESCDTSKTGLCSWDLAWGGKGAVKQETAGKNKYLLIQGNSEKSVGFAEQTVKIGPGKGIQIITIKAKISTENVAGKGAGLNIGMYDKTGALLATKDMGGFYSLDWIKGTTTWQPHTLTAICPEAATTLKIGAILYGKGQARFDDYEVKLIPVKGRKPSKLAVKYVSAAVDSIARHSLVRDSLNLDKLKKDALQIAGNAKTYPDCHPAVNYLLEALRPFGDHHSFFMKPEEVKSWKDNTVPATAIHFPEAKVVEGCGYLTVPAFHGGNKQLMLAYTDSLQEALQRVDRSGIKGWIVDLRENTGGNMEPMITGLGPIFDAEKLGSLIDVNGRKESWYYKNGAYSWDHETGMVASKPVKLTARRPVAVLTSAQTGSSGEIVVISFIGNAKTKSFGQPTWGLTTGNGSFDLPDGARMMLASTVMADRNDRKYQGRIPPDFVIEQPNKKGEDPVLKAAISWILKEK